MTISDFIFYQLKIVLKHHSISHPLHPPTLSHLNSVHNSLVVKIQLRQHLVQKLQPLLLNNEEQVFVHPIRHLVHTTHSPLLQKVQSLSDQHYYRLVVRCLHENLKHQISIVIVKLRGCTHLVVHLQNLTHVVLVLRLLKLTLTQHQLHYTEQTLTHLASQLHVPPRLLFLPLLVVGVLNHRLNLRNDG